MFIIVLLSSCTYYKLVYVNCSDIKFLFSVQCSVYPSLSLLCLNFSPFLFIVVTLLDCFSFSCWDVFLCCLVTHQLPTFFAICFYFRLREIFLPWNEEMYT